MATCRISEPFIPADCAIFLLVARVTESRLCEYWNSARPRSGRAVRRTVSKRTVRVLVSMQLTPSVSAASGVLGNQRHPRGLSASVPVQCSGLYRPCVLGLADVPDYERRGTLDIAARLDLCEAYSK